MTPIPPTHDNIRAALAFVSPDIERDEWARTLAAVKSALGDDGKTIAREWSSDGCTFTEESFRDTWKSIKAQGGVTVATLWHKAKEEGWRPDREAHQETEAERLGRERRQKARAEKEANDSARREHEAARKMMELWKSASDLQADHLYFSRKLPGATPPATLREIQAAQAAKILGYAPKSDREPLQGRLIVAPVKICDKVTTAELIDENGRKSAIYGGPKGGGYWAAQPMPEGDGAGLTVLVAEGIATALSAKDATGSTTVAALSAGNLPAIAKAMRERYPAAKLGILADLGNGQAKAEQAARETGAALAIPQFNREQAEAFQGERGKPPTDFNDLAHLAGADAVRGQIEAVLAVGGIVAVHDPDGSDTAQIDLIHGASLRPEPIEWLWNGWLAAGKFHVLAGAPGTGKTTIALALAATITTGGRWPDGSRALPGNVLIWSGEDDPKDTLVPRLIASGADMNRVYFVGDVFVDGKRRAFDPATDMAQLVRQATKIGGIKLLIVDPIVSAVAGDSHKNAEVRRGLQPLVDLGQMLGSAVLGISHFSKSTAGRDPVERVTGSIAFGALARVVMAAAKLPEDDQNGGSRIFCRSKSNLGPDDGGFRYGLEQMELRDYPGVHASYVLWGAEQSGAARELLGQADATSDPDARSATDEAEEWLREVLRNGPMKASDAQKEARQAGIGEKPLRSARERLGIKPAKQSFSGGWYWGLPGNQDAQEDRTCHTKLNGNLGHVGHLRDDVEVF